MQPKIARIFLCSAGILLLIVAAALVVSNWTPLYLQPPADPIFMISIHTLFRIVAGMVFVTSLLCLFGERGKWQAACVAWLATNGLLYFMGFIWSGGRSLNGYFAGFPEAFDISARTAGVLAEVIFVYLLIGSYGLLLWPGAQTELQNPVKNEYLKIPCVLCDGHIEFPAHAIGQKISCPHCAKTIMLLDPS